MFNLHLENAECKYLNGQLAEVEQHLGYLSGKALYNTDHTNVCLVKMRVHISKGEMLPAINTALQYLKFFHLSIPLHPTEEDVIAAYETVNQGIGNRKIEDLTNLPLMEDIEIQSVMRILSELYAPAYFSNPNLFFLLLTQMINLSMKYGNTNASVLAYGAFGYGLAAAYKKYEEGYHFAKSGVELADKHNFLSYKAKALFFFAIVSFWRKDINTSMDLCRQAFSHALETGDIHIAGYSCINYITFRNIKGEDLDEFSNAIQGYLDYVRKVKFIDMETQLISFQAFAESMQGHTFNISTFNKYDFNEELFEKVLQDRIPAIQCYYYILKLKVKYISGNFDEALIAASTANNLIQYILGLGEITEFYFFYSLTLSAKYKLASDEEKKIYLNILLQNQKIYEVWTESSPETFDNKHKLISAEICRITFRKEEAMSLYEAALRSSKKNNFPADEAICYEVASRFYFDEGFGEFGRLYIKKAIEAYFKWGALGKVKQLEVLYPFIREADTVSSSASLAGIPVEHLDIVAITNAFQVISSEIVLEQLIKSMIQIMIKQAGAQKAFLFLEWKNEIHIAAEAAVVNNKTEINVFDSFLTPDPEIVPASIIAYTRRTFEKVIIQDAKQPNLYSEDPYFKENSISSIACIPIIKQAKLLGILYLENNIFTNAFTLDKTSVLEILSSQAAISIENAMLFKELSLSRQWFQDMIDNSSSYIFVKQLDGRYLFINKGYENLYGIPRDKLVSKTDYQIWPEEVADTTTAHDMEVLEKKQALTYEEKGALHGETRHYITVRFPLLDNTGKPYAVGGISTDITNIKAAKEQLRQKTEELLETNQELIQTNIELKRVNNDLDNFIYTASHDLKAPISNMEGLLITLFQDYYEECPEGTKQLLEMMNVSVHNLKRTIHELTDISTIQKNIKEDYSLVNIEEIYEEYKKSHEELIEKCKVTFHIEFDITEILFSKKNLRSIFNNLVNNAIKYHHPGRVPEISITTRREDNFMVLSVADNGLGFDISQKDKIFGMFKRLHNHVKGSGVGLYIVKRIVENSGGKIEVESKPDKGSVFSIYLQLTVK
jgi:PAS domain S-box-containing protein